MKKIESQLAAINRNGRRHPNLLGPDKINLGAWPPLNHENYRNGSGVIATGSLSALLPELYEALCTQRMETSSIAQIVGASATARDLGALQDIAENRPACIKVSKGIFPARSVLHPNSPVVRATTLGRGHVDGLGSDQLEALASLQTHPLVHKELDRLAYDIAQTYYAHRVIAANNVHLEAFGGTRPWQQYVAAKVAHYTKENFRVRVTFLPSADEPLCQRNARGDLFKMVGDGVGKKELVILAENEHRGLHDRDDALTHGFSTIVSTGRSTREHDAASLLNSLRSAGYGWVQARPVVVRVPLTSVSEQWLFWGREYLVDIPESVGGRMLETVLTEAKHLLALDPDSFHLLVACGLFTDADIDDLKLEVKSILPNRVILVVNRLYPRVEGNTGRWTLCDFVVAEQLPKPMVEFFQAGRQRFSRPGLTPEQFLESVPPPDELAQAKQVDEGLKQLL